MKNILPIIFITLSALATMSSSCNNKTIKAAGTESSEETSIITESTTMVPHSDEEDCHGLRKTIRKITEEEGEILLIGDNVLISIPPGTKRYKICEIDDNIKIAGTKVKFTGEVLEIFSNERLMGTPFRLRNIETIR